MNYTPNIRKSSQTFVSVLQKAKDWFASLSKTEQQNLIDDLEHGAAHTLGKRMKEFGDKLQGYTLAYKLEKHTDDWDKPYSCQIYIFVSSYY